jgi:LuxR family transcriptional regulator, maltose regulon positive regulatory protein
MRASLLRREHLLAQLDQSYQVPLTLLSASAGFGKTTLLACWARQSTSRVAWLSLDSLDNDPLRFWTAVIAALRTCEPSVGEAAFALLQAPQPPALSAILTELLNDLAAYSKDMALILDDYHVVEDQTIHSSFVFLLEHLPTPFHVLLSSRIDPPLALSRWRARGQMIEIRDSDLRLNEVETASFLRRTMGLQLEKDHVLQLQSRTEGWIAGLQLAALSLSRRADPAAWISTFSGSHRFILDYVQEEILTRQPPAHQQFLLQTAVLTRLTASLCQAVTGEPASQGILETLERANLFLVPLDEERQWYRFHALFREALLARLQITQSEQVALLHRRAASWYKAQGLLDEAIAHALSAEDFVFAADLIERFINPQSWRNEYQTLRGWLARLPKELLRVRPELSFMYAQAMIFTSPRGPRTLELVEESLRLAEQGYRTTSNQARLGAVLSQRSLLVSYQGDYTQAIALAKQALTLLPEHDHQWLAHCFGFLGIEAFLVGQMTRARQFFQQTLACYEIAGSLPGMEATLALLGEVCLGRGELVQATHYYHRALACSDEREELVRLQLTLETGARELFYEQRAHYGLAGVLYEQNRLAEAEQYLNQALSQGQFIWLHILIPGLLLQVRLKTACGEIPQVQESLSGLAAQVQRSEMLREIRLCQAWLALHMGDLAHVQQWAASYAQETESLSCIRREEEVLLLARLRIAEHQPQAALDMLAPWKQEARAQERRHSELQILILEVLAHETSGAHEQAVQTLLETVIKARPDGYQRLFLDEGEVMETLLKALVPDLREQVLASYVDTLLRTFASTSTKPDTRLAISPSLLLEPLTPQEQRVLLLMAEGASNQQIANQLVISVATARKHVSNILGKLGVQNRTQAIVRAQEYSLLS